MSHWNKEQALTYDQQWGELAFHRQIPTLARVSENQTIVEIGCGGGYLSLCLAQAADGVSVLALDPTEQMIALANQRRLQAGLSAQQVEFLQSGAEALNVAHSSVDLVIAAFSLHHWNDADLAMSLIFNSLKPGARIWLCEDMNTPNEGALEVNKNLKAYAGIQQLLEKFTFSRIEKRMYTTSEGEFLIVEAVKPM